MSQLFDRLCEEITRQSGLTMLQARGMFRLVLKEAGVVPERLQKREAAVVIKKLLGAELRVRKVDQAEQVCATLLEQLDSMANGEVAADDAEAIFTRFHRG